MRYGAREIADATNVGRAFGHADRAACVEQVERMRRFEHLLVSGQRQLLLHQKFRFGLVIVEMSKQRVGVAVLKVVRRLLHFVLVEHIAVIERACFAVFFPLRPHEVVNVVHTLQVHDQALKPERDLAGDRLARQAAYLLEVRELRHLHAVHPHFPT